MAETKQPALTKVDQLRPATASLTIVVKVLSSKLIATRGRSDGPPSRQLRLAECLVGDETGIIVFTARRDQGCLHFSSSSSPVAFCFVEIHVDIINGRVGTTIFGFYFFLLFHCQELRIAMCIMNYLNPILIFITVGIFATFRELLIIFMMRLIFFKKVYCGIARMDLMPNWILLWCVTNFSL